MSDAENITDLENAKEYITKQDALWDAMMTGLKNKREIIGKSIERVRKHEFDDETSAARKFWREGYIAALEVIDGHLQELIWESEESNKTYTPPS